MYSRIVKWFKVSFFMLMDVLLYILLSKLDVIKVMYRGFFLHSSKGITFNFTKLSNQVSKKHKLTAILCYALAFLTHSWLTGAFYSHCTLFECKCVPNKLQQVLLTELTETI